MKIQESFAELFGATPDVVATAPGRVNLIGEHVDYVDGFVLPFAISDSTIAAISKRNDNVIRVASVQQESKIFETTVENLAPGKPGNWERYPVGVLWALGITSGVDLLIDGSVPLGAGLSSSAALECSVAVATNALFNLQLNVQELARVAQKAENDYVGMPCGIMDQSVSLMARAGSALLLDCRDISTKNIPFDLAPEGLELLVIDTQVHHALVDGGYAERRANCESVAQKMGVKALRDITMSQLESAKSTLSDIEFRRATHGVSEIARVLDAVKALESKDFLTLGALINQSHNSLRDQYSVSCPELDQSVETARKCGAIGARMIGGGFGGSAIAIVKAGASESISQAITEAFASKSYGPPRFFTSLANAGAHLL